ncbi:hypothetical protein [Streptomyces sp. NPDC021020]|uniref:hypothetical protein n=1 Tax=Streptomyces sp. NPDC021020 TaxID=3365109 RepID=UPI0037A27E7A
MSGDSAGGGPVTAAAAELPHGRQRFLVPLVAHARWMTAGCVAGTAAGLAVALSVGSQEQDWETFNLTGQLVLLGVFLVVVPWAQLRQKTRRSLAEGYAAAVPLQAPPAVRRDHEGRDAVRRRLALDAAVTGLVGVLLALFGVWRLHVPLLVLLLPLLFAVFAVGTRSTRRWEREHGVVLWRPALGRAVGTKGPGLYVTPAEVRPPV